MAARIKADDQNIPAPQSVTKLTCLSNFFSGTGLDVSRIYSTRRTW